MVTHLSDAARMALGEISIVRPRVRLSRLFRVPVIKDLVVYRLPFPKSVPSVDELFSTRPGDWAHDVARVVELHERAAGYALERDPAWAEHPLFGALSTNAWGVLGYRHADHHLRQFGA